MSNPCIYTPARNLHIFSLLNSRSSSSSCSKDISYNKIVTSFNDPSMSRRMRYAQYVRNYKYTYIAEACGDNTGLRVSYPPSNIVATILPNLHPAGSQIYDMSYSVIFTWKRPCFTGCTPITSYRIKSVPGDLTSLITPLEPRPIINGLQYGVTYVFQVISINTVGDSHPSEPSNRILQYNFPRSPYNISGILGDKRIDFTWNEPFNGGSNIVYYNVHLYGIAPIRTTNLTTNFTNLTPGRSYSVDFTAVNSYGESYPATYTFIGPAYPDNPANITFTYVNTSIIVDWSVPISDGYYPIDLYRVVYKDQFNMTTNYDVSSNVYTATINNLSIGQPYTFSVIAHNIVGFRTDPTIFTIVPCRVSQSPSITNIIYTADRSGLIVQWNPPLYNGGGTILSYSIIYESSGRTVRIVVPVTSVSYTVYGLVTNLVYSFTMTATNNAGTSTPSNEYTMIF